MRIYISVRHTHTHVCGGQMTDGIQSFVHSAALHSVRAAPCWAHSRCGKKTGTLNLHSRARWQVISNNCWMNRPRVTGRDQSRVTRESQELWVNLRRDNAVRCVLWLAFVTYILEIFLHQYILFCFILFSGQTLWYGIYSHYLYSYSSINSTALCKRLP